VRIVVLHAEAHEQFTLFEVTVIQAEREGH